MISINILPSQFRFEFRTKIKEIIIIITIKNKAYRESPLG